jgi:hypothetical protein
VGLLGASECVARQGWSKGVGCAARFAASPLDTTPVMQGTCWVRREGPCEIGQGSLYPGPGVLSFRPDIRYRLTEILAAYWWGFVRR